MHNVKTVLILSTYPIEVPQHGGQVRLANIKRAYERAGWNVLSLAVYAPESYSPNDSGPLDIPFPVNNRYRLFEGRSLPFVTDLLAGSFATAQDGALPSILARIRQPIDIIHVEQPWLWPLAQELRNHENFASAAAIYGSQNIEEPLKRQILEAYRVAGADNILKAVDNAEKTAARQADLTLAVTEDDLNVIRGWGAKKAVLVPNGIEAWQSDAETLSAWQKKLPKSPWLLYVASAHLPNFTNFTQLLGESLGCFPPTSRLVIAGGVTEHIYREATSTRWITLNQSRLQLLFVLSEQDLAAVKSLAHGFVLPIPFGGGSNIKTAEALYSGAHVIGSPAAFRGYEDFVELPEVNLARDPKEFQRVIRSLLTQPRVQPPATGSPAFTRRQALLWDNRLASLPALAGSLQREECAQ